eukprot:m.259420 g.259420  ORF g.259420 m.259420 type:complete len:157 (+) comp26772_c1_seq21:1109-1579(+)
MFIDELVNMKDKVITAYNGASFDFYYLIDELTARGIDVNYMILNGGKVLKFSFNGNRVFDLCPFVQASLDKACKAFQIDNAKSTFEHKKIQSWNDVETYRPEVEPDLKLDVMGLKELFEKFNKIIYIVSKTNITNYLTLSHMAYSIWADGPPCGDI